MIRYGACLNTFILGLDDGRPYPCLNISVNNKYANIVYLPDDESAGSQSIGNGTDLKLNESTNFCMGFVTELYECSNEYVVLFEQALKAALEFFETSARPTCINWFDL